MILGINLGPIVLPEVDNFFLLGGHLFFEWIFISFFRKRLEKRYTFV